MNPLTIENVEALSSLLKLLKSQGVSAFEGFGLKLQIGFVVSGAEDIPQDKPQDEAAEYERTLMASAGG